MAIALFKYSFKCNRLLMINRISIAVNDSINTSEGVLNDRLPKYTSIEIGNEATKK